MAFAGQTSLDVFFRTQDTRFNVLVNQATEWSNSNGLVHTQPIQSQSITHGWPARLPQGRKWERAWTHHDVSAHAKTVNMIPYELTWDVDRFMMEDDIYGIVSGNMLGLARQAKKHQDYQLRDFLKTADSVLGYDGVPYFATNHPVNGGDAKRILPKGTATTQSNLAVNAPLNFTNLVAARAAMRNQLGEDGVPWGVNPTLLVVPPQLQGVGEQLVDPMSKLIANGVSATNNTPGANVQTNTLAGAFKLLVVDDLASMPNNWWLYDTSSVVKPFTWYQRTAAEFTYIIDPTHPLVYEEHKYSYGWHLRGNIAESVYYLGYAGTSESTYQP